MARQQIKRTKNVQDRYYQRDHYVDGTTARKLQAVPDYNDQSDYDDYDDYDYEEERRRKQQTYQERKRRERAAKRRREKTKTMDGVSLLLLVGAVTLTFFVCIQYIRVQADMTALSKSIAAKESEVIKLKKDNNAAMEEISRTYDLSYVYKIATKELGMVFPEKDQVIKYDSQKSDYVKQFEEIPSDEDVK
ncbi:septum formation initiator family protein [Anaerosporobacter faecicola]|uniref:septum formation initiator family protein n=1 Tax=Anaerosporobacter faecicola TaxID=2718714 RepID=UPI00143963A7|nr:septum formation initiator family protein [Anaerosporobacter faecicola]